MNKQELKIGEEVALVYVDRSELAIIRSKPFKVNCLNEMNFPREMVVVDSCGQRKVISTELIHRLDFGNGVGNPAPKNVQGNKESSKPFKQNVRFDIPPKPIAPPGL
jgi:hypothetical protein